MRWVAVAVLASIGLLPVIASAQSASPTDLQTEMKRKRFVIQPKPSPEIVSEDVERTREALEAEQRREEIVRDARRPIPRRPDLGYDVTSGIQQRNLQRALRR